MGSALPGISGTVPLPLDGILQALAGQLSELKTALDISALDKNCFAFNPATDAQKIFFQELISKICDIETEIGTLQTQLSGISTTVLNTSIPATIDLKCLLPNPNPCGSVYSLGQVLQLIINKLCP
jgi:hypothetical protein